MSNNEFYNEETPTKEVDQTNKTINKEDLLPSAQADELIKAPIAPKPPLNLKKEIISWVLTIGVAVIAAFLIRTFIFVPVRVDGGSMSDTLIDQEYVFVTKFDYLFSTPQRQDVVICRYPDRTETFVKRLIGLPGDTLEIKYDSDLGQKIVYINGLPLDEPYLTLQRNSRNLSFGPITLGEDEYFVMGDNRDNSNDSRAVGPISKKAIEGHVRFVHFPFNKWRVIH